MWGIVMYSKKIDQNWSLKLRLNIEEATFVMGVSRSTLYRRQGIDSYPKIISDGGRSYVLTEDIISWIKQWRAY